MKKLWNTIANNPVMLAAVFGIIAQVALELQSGLAQMERLSVAGVITLALGVIASRLVTSKRKQRRSGGATTMLVLALALPLSGCEKGVAVNWPDPDSSCVPPLESLIAEGTAILLSGKPMLPQVENMGLQHGGLAAVCAIEYAMEALERTETRSAQDAEAIERGNAFLVAAGRR